MIRLIFCLLLILKITFLNSQGNFSFVYLPDIHLQPDSDKLLKFEHLAAGINNLHPDFVLTGGDMIYTAKNGDDVRAKILFDLMDRELKKFVMPVYLTMGNHEHVGITAESNIDDTHPMWGKRMYEQRYGNPYYTFQYGGWKFFILDGIKILKAEKNYTQSIDSLQIEWIRNELLATDKSMPIVISIHPPLINPHAISNPGTEALSSNSADVLNLFRDHNLKIVLEGHTHLYMNLLFNGIHYISGGSTAPETSKSDDGFVLVQIKNGSEELHFVQPCRSATTVD
jgi:Icc protein